MNSGQILTNILTIADYPAEKREEFITTFYEYLLTQLLNEASQTDQAASQKLGDVLQNPKSTPSEIEQVLREISQNPQIKEAIDKVTEEVLGKFVDDIDTSATEEQKQQMLSALPTSASSAGV
jgi:translation initiation factor RLI1